MSKRTEAYHIIEFKNSNSFKGKSRYRQYAGPIKNKKEALRIASEFRKKTERKAKVVSIYNKPKTGIKVKESPNYYIYVS